MAVKDEFGIRWISEITGKDGAKQIYDISLSHGSAAIVAFLSNCVKSKYNYPNLTETMLSGSIRYILHQKQENNAALFPGFCSINEKPNTNNFSRLSWCYGDMGIGLAIWQAGEALKDEKLKQEAIEIYLNSTKRRTPEETGDVNVGICHGSAGLAHMYNRMYWNTKMPEFKKAANYWIEETLKLTKFGDSYVEFKSGVEDEWDNDFGFLGGISGIGLALLSHISNEEPTWDKALLMS
jgi:lantibiotic modifying enzyme